VALERAVAQAVGLQLGAARVVRARVELDDEPCAAVPAVDANAVHAHVAPLGVRDAVVLAVADVAALQRRAGVGIPAADQPLRPARADAARQAGSGLLQAPRREGWKLVGDPAQLLVGEMVCEVDECAHAVGHTEGAVGDDVVVTEVAGPVDLHPRLASDGLPTTLTWMTGQSCESSATHP
jgi:hypothetical protein